MLDKEQGVQAIIDLQKSANIDEPRDKAERAWESFSDDEKEVTENTHRMLHPDKYVDRSEIKKCVTPE